MSLDSIINLSISRETAAVSQAGFGVPLIVGPNAGFAEAYRTYTDMATVAADFEASTEEYQAANAVFAQTPKPEKLMIAQREANTAAVKTLTFSADAVTGNSIAGTVNGVSLTATAYATTHQATMTALAAKIAAIDGVASAVVDTTPFHVITVTATEGRALTLAGFAVTGGASQATVAIATTTAGVTVADALDAIVAASGGDDWYALLLTSRLEADILQAAAWVESRKKIFLACSDASGILTSGSTDVAAKLNAAGYARTALLYHHAPSAFPEAAWAGKCLPLDPGSETWKFKTLAGVAYSPVSAAQYTQLDQKNANSYERLGGVAITREGTMAVGEYVDVVRFIDWLHARIQERLYAALIRNKKLPMTDQGAAVIESEIRAQLQDGVRVGGLTDGSVSVTVPKMADVSPTDKAARKLPSVAFAAQLAGAIHAVTINGSVSL